MKFLSKINTTAKMAILVIYAVVLTLLAIFIININNIDETEGYGTSARDENIQIASKIVESRTAASLSSDTAKERSSWTVSLQITKNNPNVEVSNIEAYVKATTQDGSNIYFEESKKDSTSYKGTPSTTSANFVSYSSNINKTNTYSSSKKEYTKTNNELKFVYIRVTYKVAQEDGTETNKELKYYYVPVKPEQEDFNTYNEVVDYDSEDTKLIEFDDSSKYYNLFVKLTRNEEKTTEEKVQSDRIVPSFKVDESYIKEQGKYVTSASVTVFAKVKNDPSDTENYFSDYITVMDIHGAFVNQDNTAAWTAAQLNNLSGYYKSTCSINTTYEASELYILFTITTSDGKTTYNKVRVNLLK